MVDRAKLFVRTPDDATALVTCAYNTILRRPPDEAGLDLYVRLLMAGEMSPVGLMQSFEASDEANAKAGEALESLQSHMPVVPRGSIDLSMNGISYTLSGDVDDPYFRHATSAEGSFAAMGSIVGRCCAADSCLIDVGANIGLSAVFLSGLLPQARILALEPSPKNYGYLSRNVKSNQLSNVETRQVAVSNNVGTLLLHEGKHFGAGNYVLADSRLQSDDVMPVSVEAKPLDQIVEEENLDRVDFIKIDVEGSELDVLDGMQETIRRFEPVVFMEINTWALVAWRNLTPRALLDRFLDLCPHAFSFHGQSLIDLKTKDDRFKFLHRHFVTNNCIEDVVGSPDPNRIFP